MKNDERKSLGVVKKDVAFPVTPKKSEMDKAYFDLRDSVVTLIKQGRVRVLSQANSQMNLLYWQIGKEILRRQEKEGWGTKVIDRLSHDLREEFPDSKSYSPRNLKFMRQYATVWPDKTIVKQVVSQIPWRSIISLMQKLDDEDARLWYAQRQLMNGWSSNVLDLMIESNLIHREGHSINNFKLSLPDTDSDLANQAFKDPYLFDFIGADAHRRESDIERSLTHQIEKFLLELGQGFAFVGRQVHLELGGQDFYLDLLFYHLKLRCFVVIELKACEFDPGFVSKLNMYQNVVDDVLRHPDDRPTIGLLLVKGKNRTVVEYSLAGFRNPIGVADWQDKLTKILPDDLKSSLPTIEEIEAEMREDN
jgi:predicted nuclease of restriction endonuclease-like (RecB) superfamily